MFDDSRSFYLEEILKYLLDQGNGYVQSGVVVLLQKLDQLLVFSLVKLKRLITRNLNNGKTFRRTLPSFKRSATFSADFARFLKFSMKQQKNSCFPFLTDRSTVSTNGKIERINFRHTKKFENVHSFCYWPVFLMVEPQFDVTLKTARLRE